MSGEVKSVLVFHVDANSAYLSWTAAAMLEQGCETDIREIPSAIAGDPENRHGIILAKSIPAKQYGVITGESIYEARKKCPNLQVFAPDYDLFLRCSDAMYEILSGYTPVIQRYSVDECFCDMTCSPAVVKDPVKTAYEIKDRIRSELGFTVNIGIGTNKLCAKMAGELRKPDMVHTLWHDELPEKLWPLPVRELFMVGRATERKLAKFNIRTIGDLAKANPVFLRTLLKSHGQLVYEYANGIDNSSVTVNSEIIRKGIGNGLTYPYDMETEEEIFREVLALCERVGSRLRKLKRTAGLVSVYLRSSSLSGYSHQVRLYSCIDTTTEIYDTAKQLIREMWKGEPVRAMSISVAELTCDEHVQLSIFDRKEREKAEHLDRAVDEIRNMFGDGSIFRGTFANSDTEPMQGGVNDGNYIMMGGYKQ